MFQTHAMWGLSSSLGLPQSLVRDMAPGRKVPPGPPVDHTKADHSCLDCILQQTKPKSKERTSRLRKLWEVVASGVSRDISLLSLSFISAAAHHPQLRSGMMGYYSHDEFVSVLIKTDFFKAAASQLALNLDEDTVEQEQCCAYYILSTVGSIAQTITMREPTKYTAVELDPTEYFHKESASHPFWETLIASGLLPLIIRSMRGDKRLFEQLRATWALRQIIFNESVAREIYGNSEVHVASVAYDALIDFPKKVSTLQRTSFVEYEFLLSSMGIAGDKSVDPMTLTGQDCLDRLFKRVSSFRENALELIATCAILPETYHRQLFADERDLVLSLLDILQKCPIFDDEYDMDTIPISHMLGNLCVSDKKLAGKLMGEPYLFLEVLEYFILASPITFSTRSFISAAYVLFTNTSKRNQKLIGRCSPLFSFLMAAMLSPYDYLKESAMSLLSELLMTKAVPQEEVTVKRMQRYISSLAFMTIRTPAYADHAHFIIKVLAKSYDIKVQWGIPKSKWKASFAIEKKQLGNDFFRKKDYSKAKELYASGLECIPSCYSENCGVDLHNNLSICCIKLEQYEEALYHTTLVLLNDENNPKALLRRELALSHLGPKYEDARVRTKSFYEISINIDTSSEEKSEKAKRVLRSMYENK